MKKVAIIQARTNSSRLRGKISLPLAGIPVLIHVARRVSQMNYIDDIVIATTVNAEDEPVANMVKSHGFKCFRGDEEDVLGRYYMAAAENTADVVVRFTADCPLIDPHVSDAVVRLFLDNSCDIAANTGAERTFPRGFDTEVFSFGILKKAFEKAANPYQREHVTPYMYETGRGVYLKNDTDYSGYRLTLDTPEDYELIKIIYDKLYGGKHNFYMTEIVKLLEKNPEFTKINAEVQQKTI